jgi:hypothetical protein
MTDDLRVAENASEDTAVAAVVFEGPLGPEGVVITEAMGPAVTFGRGAPCQIRFGYAPEADIRLARHAGALLLANGRVLVESSGEAHHPALQVRSPSRPPVEVSGGEAYAPGEIEFDVVVRGEREWLLSVRTRRWRPPPSPGPGDAGGGEPATYRPGFSLSPYELDLLRAYLAPMRDGRLEPATHAEVAAAMHYSVTKVRVDLYAVWARMVTEGLAVTPYPDKRLAVARAALAYGLT